MPSERPTDDDRNSRDAEIGGDELWVYVTTSFIAGWLFGWIFAVVHGDIEIHKTAKLTVSADDE
jgi:hypothetical protein